MGSHDGNSATPSNAHKRGVEASSDMSEAQFFPGSFSHVAICALPYLCQLAHKCQAQSRICTLCSILVATQKILCRFSAQGRILSDFPMNCPIGGQFFHIACRIGKRTNEPTQTLPSFQGQPCDFTRSTVTQYPLAYLREPQTAQD